ncbi:MAG TPA: serine/threonine-protein kinase [Gemmatimonadaceae bacterium]|nr:serine/threonine-protein kinase [Gemmatimonadaceae bacterium]
MPERYLGRSLGRFRVDALIGSGGFAWVYKGFDPELEIPVALKVLKPQYAGDEKFETRFRREASTAAKLRHPNIIKIFAVGREEDAVFFAMDYLPQGLADRLNVMTTLPEPMLVRMAIDIASALGFAHREGVIHRDIKTDNILFDEHGNAVVADFGIARAVSGYAEQTGTNMVVGTPQYFAPEQARGLQLDGRADIYSLGVTLFKASTGQLPFNGTDWYEIARQHVEDKPPRPRSFNPALSREVEDVILQCLEKDPEKRFSNGEELGEVLMRLMAERGETMALRGGFVQNADTVSGPVSISQNRLRRSQSIRRRRSVAAAVGGASAVLAGILWWGIANTDAVQPPPSGRPARPGPAPPLTQPIRATPRPDSSPPAAMVVTAPSYATVAVNGVEVGRGPWRSDTVKPGRHVIAASVRSIDGCPAASVTKTVNLEPSGEQEFQLYPRACGRLDLDVTPSGGTYRLISTIDQNRTGTVPLPTPLTVPAGRYRLTVEVRECAPFNDDSLVIRPGELTRRRVPLICGKQ